MNARSCRVLAMVLLSPAAAFAHSTTDSAGLMHGFAHPLGGIDHLLAMMAVGFLAARFEGSRRWLLPITFLISMSAGGWMGANQLPLPFVEGLIALSLIIFGIAIVAADAPPVGFIVPLVAVFALFHGHAHGSEFSGSSMILYSAGFISSTALIHVVGLWLSLRATTLGVRARDTVRVGGGSIAVTGLALLGALTA